MTPAGGSGPVVFAYDGSELAKHAIGEAGRLLEAGGEALVVTVWQPFDVGFLPPPGSNSTRRRSPTSGPRPRKPQQTERRLRRPRGFTRKAPRSRGPRPGRGSPSSPMLTTRG